MSRPRRIEIDRPGSEAEASEAQRSKDRRGLRILGEIVLWTLGLAVFLTIGRMLGTTAPGLLAGLKVVLLNPVALVLLFGGGIAIRVLMRRRRERRSDR